MALYSLTVSALAALCLAAVASAAPLRGEPWRLQEDVAALHPTDSVFLCGQRATAEVLLASEQAGRTAFAPVDAYNHLQVRFDPEPTLKSVLVSPVVVEKVWEFADGATVTSTWRVDADRPVLQAVFEFRGPAAGRLKCQVTADVASNVGYVNKFAQHDDDTARVKDGGLEFTDGLRPALGLRVWMLPRAAGAAVAPAAGAPPGHCTGTLTSSVRIGPGGRQCIELRAAAADTAAELEALSRPFALRAPQALLPGAFSFECPDAGLNEFVRACCATIALNVRELPFGPPYAIDAARNERLPVVTASPDYHGIFANDCVQTLWEAGLLGHGLDRAAQNSVEAMLGFGPHESVEWWTGDGKVWSFTAPLGDTPQTVIGACWHLLWTGDRPLAERWWPDIERCLAVLKQNDADGDWLEDRRNTPYPEQPDPGAYDHEMLYVQCFWHQAYRKASDVAEWLGKPDAASLRETAGHIAQSIEARFATDYGLAAWLDKSHRPHPHIGHEQIIAAEQGDVSDERARLIVRTATSPSVWTPDGPLRSDPGKGVAAGDHVWTFMRWKLVLAMFRLGETDRALELARTWAAQERSARYSAPEGFPTITGTTGKAYTWTAGRALRAIALGLSGLALDGKGVRFTPKLPSGWDHYAMERIPVHGASVSLRVRRGEPRVLIDGRSAADAFLPYARLHSGHRRVEAWVR